MLLHKETALQDLDYWINGYGSGYIEVNQERLEQNLIVSAKELHRCWAPQAIEDLSIESLSPALRLEPSILLIGTGPTGLFLPPALLAAILARRIGVEVMDTPSACRTYNILAGDGRSVAAALMLP